MKILVIDDERAIRNSLKEILGDEGHEVDTAENGAAGLELVEKEKYNAIFFSVQTVIVDITRSRTDCIRVIIANYMAVIHNLIEYGNTN